MMGYRLVAIILISWLTGNLQCRVDLKCMYGKSFSIDQNSITDTTVFVVKSLQNEFYPVVSFDLVVIDGKSVHGFEGTNRLTTAQVATIKEFKHPVFILNMVTTVKDGERFSFHPKMDN